MNWLLRCKEHQIHLSMIYLLRAIFIVTCSSELFDFYSKIYSFFIPKTTHFDDDVNIVYWYKHFDVLSYFLFSEFSVGLRDWTSWEKILALSCFWNCNISLKSHVYKQNISLYIFIYGMTNSNVIKNIKVKECFISCITTKKK